MTYKLSVMAMFKNESWIIREWIEHYLSEGVEHFYLIDNGSNDDYENKIIEYMQYITLVKDSTRLPYGTQSHLYNKIYLDVVKNETTWIIICDIDEYIYARNGYEKIIDVLNIMSSNIETIWIPWKVFGSNGNIEHPSSIVSAFTKRSNQPDSFLGHGKSIVRARNLVNFGCCGHYVEVENNSTIHTPNKDNYYLFDFNEDSCSKFNLSLNHYMLMSEEYYTTIKCNRGGGESGLLKKYSLDFFRESDKNNNILYDDELLNKKINLSNKLIEYKLIFKNNDIKLFNKYINNSKYYLEFGSGSSTYHASLKTNLKKIIAVENDIHWFNRVNDFMKNNKKFINLYIDIKTNHNTWGYPINDSDKTNWASYSNIVNLLNPNLLEQLDLILIDGRFRVASILKLYNYINDNCIILFNNFFDRTEYSIILDYYEIIENSEDNSMAVLKKKINNSPNEIIIKNYEYDPN